MGLKFSVWKDFNYNFNFLKNTGLFKLCISSWVSVVGCVFQGICPFHLYCWFYWCKMFIIFPYGPFSICRICSDVIFLISNIGIFCLSLISLARSLSILLIFSKNSIWFHYFSLLLATRYLGPKGKSASNKFSLILLCRIGNDRHLSL